MLQDLVDKVRTPLSTQNLAKKTKMAPPLKSNRLRMWQWISSGVRILLHDVHTAIALFDEVDRTLKKRDEISEWAGKTWIRPWVSFEVAESFY